MRNLPLGLLLLLGMPACNNNHYERNVENCPATVAPPATFIPADTANKMLESYQTSIHAATNDTDLQAIIFNADSLRSMLNDTSNGRIAKVKIMFAHTLAYINAGGLNQPCGYRSGKLTVIISGFDCNNDYVLNPQGKVMNTGFPCPPTCVTDGSAASNLFPVVSSTR